MFNFVQHASGPALFQGENAAHARLFDPPMKHHRPYQLPPPVSVLPRALAAAPDHAAVLAREQAMIDAGTHPMLAEKLARRAAENQARHDRRAQPAARPDDPF